MSAGLEWVQQAVRQGARRTPSFLSSRPPSGSVLLPALQGSRVTFWASLGAQTAKTPPSVWETWARSLGQEGPLEKEMATHSCILAWETTWTEEPGGLQSMGLQSFTTLVTQRAHTQVPTFAAVMGTHSYLSA